jgi:hypothetical protein
MGELVEKVLEMLKKNSARFVVALFVVEGYRMAVYGPFSDQRSLAEAVDTSGVGLASMRHPLPSPDEWVQVSNRAIRGLGGVVQDVGAVKR